MAQTGWKLVDGGELDFTILVLGSAYSKTSKDEKLSADSDSG